MRNTRVLYVTQRNNHGVAALHISASMNRLPLKLFPISEGHYNEKPFNKQQHIQ